MGSVSLSAFLARRVLQGMVCSLSKGRNATRGADKLTRRALPWRPADSVAALIKGTTIDGALRLAAKRHESAESINLTWTAYQAGGALLAVAANQPFDLPNTQARPLSRLALEKFFANNLPDDRKAVKFFFCSKR